MITLEVDKGSAFPGDTITVSFSALDLAPDKFGELRLFWFTQGRGNLDIGIIETFGLPPHTGHYVHKFILPQFPWSFRGQLIALSWAVEAVVGNESTRVDFIMSPTGSEIDITADPVLSGGQF